MHALCILNRLGNSLYLSFSYDSETVLSRNIYLGNKIAKIIKVIEKTGLFYLLALGRKDHAFPSGHPTEF